MTKWKKECNIFFDKNIIGKEVLDIGCGRFPHRKATKTLDVDNKFSPDVIADINEKIALPDNSFDCIIMNNVLEHLHNPKQALAECHRILKKGGVLLVAVPFLIKLHQEPVDFHRYTSYMLERLFTHFSHTIIPSKCTLTDFYKAIQTDLFGQISKKRHPMSFIASIFIKCLTPLLPVIYKENYPTGYLIIAKKTQ